MTARRQGRRRRDERNVAVIPAHRDIRLRRRIDGEIRRGKGRGTARALRFLDKEVVARLDQARSRRTNVADLPCRCRGGGDVLHRPTGKVDRGRTLIEEFDKIIGKGRAGIAAAAVKLADLYRGRRWWRLYSQRDGCRAGARLRVADRDGERLGAGRRSGADGGLERESIIARRGVTVRTVVEEALRGGAADGTEVPGDGDSAADRIRSGCDFHRQQRVITGLQTARSGATDAGRGRGRRRYGEGDRGAGGPRLGVADHCRQG